MNSKMLLNELLAKIRLEESVDEKRHIVFMVMEKIFGLSASEILTGKEITFTVSQQQQAEAFITRINNHEPVQYLLGEAYFFGRKFIVNPSVLIPRPETEELVHLALNMMRSGNQASPLIVDIGTGSGCMAITMKLELPHADVFATDVSFDALETARTNAKQLHAEVNFLHHNILTDLFPVSAADLVMSNPPYITRAEENSLQRNVVAHEPHLALFVDDPDPLLFYRAIAGKAYPVLAENGWLLTEIHEHYGNEVAEVFKANGFREVTVHRDINEKKRMVSAKK